ncbi:MAG: hypothetical protein ACREBR_00325, partial [bacterium]
MSTVDTFWYLARQSHFRKEVSDECTHRTHLHHSKLGAGEIRPKSELMDTDSLSLVNQCGKANVLTSSTSNLIAERTNLRFVKEQI